MLSNKSINYWYPASVNVWRVSDELIQGWIEFKVYPNRLKEKAFKINRYKGRIY